jgi:radical SAM superfamily enzyme YgiQ (UPF0313 family)
MKELLLVHLPDAPLDGSAPVFTPPLGLWSMRENNAGVSVEVIDLGVEEEQVFVDREAVGFSLQFPAHEDRLSRYLPNFTAERFLVGGPTGGRCTRDGFESIRGPGEDFLAGKQVPFQDLQPPAFATWEMLPYWKRAAPFSGLASHARWMPVETSRGCPNACGFCAIPAIWGRWQVRPLAMLDEYFGYLVRAHGVTEIIVTDDNVAASVPRFLQIINLFKKHDLAWSVANGIYNRALLNAEVQAAVRDSKCLYMSLPFEAGNERSASLMNLRRKYLSFEEALALTEFTRSAGIHTAGQFIIGYPGETEAEVRETLRYANALHLDQRHIHIAMPLVGTPMYDTCIRHNWLAANVDAATYKTPVIETPMLSRERLYTLWREDREQALRRRT